MHDQASGDGRLAVEVADFVTGFASDSIPAARVEKARVHIVDTLACGIGGACSAEARLTLAMLNATAERGPVPVWGTPGCLSPRAAAFANGVATHSFELDDTMGCDHSGAVVVPAAMAALTMTEGPVSGRDFIAAVVLGYEVAKRVMEALGGYWPHNRAGWHSTATCGTFGAAVASARLLGLDATQTANALGHAASFSGGLWGFIHDASQTKRIHAGRAAEGGLTAALLARAGVSGPKAVFEEVWGGFLKTFAPDTRNPQRLVEKLGDAWEFDAAAIKPYASCRGTHSTLDAIGRIGRENYLAFEDIVGVEVVSPPGLVEMCGGRDLSSPASAQMSLPFAVASFLALRKLGIAAFSQEARAATATLERMKIVAMRGDESLPASAEPSVTVKTKSGAVFRGHVDPPLGSPGFPLSRAELRDKALELMTMTLPRERAEAVFERIDALDGSPDVKSLSELLRSDREPVPFA